MDPKRAKVDKNSDFGHVRTSQTSPEGQVLVNKAVFFTNYTFPILFADLSFTQTNLSFSYKIIGFMQQFYIFYKKCFIKQNYYFSIKSYVLLSKSMIFYKITCLTKQIFIFL